MRIEPDDVSRPEVVALVEYHNGRLPWGVSGIPGFWSGDIWSSHNSQFVFDPYTFTHIIHGILFYAILSIIAPKIPVRWRLLMAVGFESVWEIMENSNLIIDRYRAVTVSLDYYGDSIVNSISDIVACMFGFFLAYRLPRKVTIIGVILIEIILALWIRDNLSLNILMLIHPVKSIQTWQVGSHH